ncbi:MULTISPECIES: hypothetical protein [Vibrio harveyi group]
MTPVLESALTGVKGQYVKVLVDISEFSGLGASCCLG